MNATVDLHSSGVPSTEQRNYKKDLKQLLCPSRSIWRRALQDRVSQNNTRTARSRPTPRPQRRLQDQDQDRFFWSQTGLVL